MTAYASRTILITGAAGGVGQAAAHAATEQGANVIALDLDPGRLRDLAAQLPAERILSLAVDVTDDGAVAAAIQAGVARFGRIDGCLNNAGIGAPLKPIVELTADEFRRVFEVNTIGMFTVLKHVLAQMVTQASGVVVNTGSILGNRGVPNYAAYCASKGAVHSLTQVAAMEMAEYGIRVNAIAPGLIDTPMNDVFHAAVSPTDPASTRRGIESKIPLRRYATAREIADVALVFVSDATSYVTGEIIDVDGGLSTSF